MLKMLVNGILFKLTDILGWYQINNVLLYMD
jgi:hypothetical protein